MSDGIAAIHENARADAERRIKDAESEATLDARLKVLERALEDGLLALVEDRPLNTNDCRWIAGAAKELERIKTTRAVNRGVGYLLPIIDET